MASDWLFMGYRLKIKLIFRLTIDQDQAFFSISTRDVNAFIFLKNDRLVMKRRKKLKRNNHF